MSIFSNIETDLDLNGPILAFTTQPSDVTTAVSTASFTVAAQATFTGNSAADGNDAGTIKYQWYKVRGPNSIVYDLANTDIILADNANISGAKSTTLTLSNLTSPGDSGTKYYCQISYEPGDEYATAEKGTGTSLNEPVKSNQATLTINPTISIDTQPTDELAKEGFEAEFFIGASLSDSSFLFPASPIKYEWYVGVGASDPIKVENKRYTTQNVSSTVETVIEEGTATDTTYHSFSQNYSSDSDVNIPPTGYNITLGVGGASGGNGGSDADGSGGSGGAGRHGTFTMPDSQGRGRLITFRTGRAGGGGGRGTFPAYGGNGSSNIAPGGRGGGAGPRGWSGGGGGGGGASGILRDGGELLACAGGGGGGGGGSWKRPASRGFDANSWYPYNGGTINTYSGGTGGDCPSDGGGGGGGGGGSGGPAGGGGAGFDKRYGGGGGGGGNSDYRSDIISLSSQGGVGGDGFGSISFNYTTSTTRPIQIPVEVTVPNIIYQNTDISGQGTPRLKIRSDESAFNPTRRVYCVVSHPSATNGPLTSDEVTSTVYDPTLQDFLIVETISTDDTAEISTVNLGNGEKVLDGGAQDISNTGTSLYLYSLYSPDKDLNVEMDLYGGRGDNAGGGAGGDGGNGGEGGFSRIQFTMDQNVEYMIAGLTQSVGTPFLYRKANLIACVGKGGDAGKFGDGGKGGGIGQSGQDGFGRGPGKGGPVVMTGNLPAEGIFGSSSSFEAVSPDTKATGNKGGRVASCTRGVYYRNQGISACGGVGNVKFRADDGTVLSETGEIERGFKAGYNVIQTAGARVSVLGGLGGAGATGGEGSSGGGSGGGSGYTDGSVNVISTTRPGTMSFKYGRVVIRVVEPPKLGTVQHSFNNSNNTNRELTSDGSITAVSSESMNSADRQVGTSLGEKHYLITMNKNYGSLNVISVSQYTAGGGYGGNNSAAKIERVNDTQWRIWFNKGNGYNTYVQGFSVEGAS